MSTRLSISLVLGAAALFAAGCQSTINSTEPANPDAKRYRVAEKRIISDPNLDRRVSIQAVNEKVGPAGFLTVQVELLNTTTYAHRFSYKFEWFDEQGMEVGGPASVFVPRQIEGKEDIFISATSPNEHAKDYRLKLIETH